MYYLKPLGPVRFQQPRTTPTWWSFLLRLLLLLQTDFVTRILAISPEVPPHTSRSNSRSGSTCSNDPTNMTKFRSVQRVLERPHPHWVGNGFYVYPVFADWAFTEKLSPLLMFDYGVPKAFPSNLGTRPRGVGQHPHRGFETVTIAFQGEVEHHDNQGHSGVIGPGDVQWMTAGSGIVHEEYHSKNFSKGNTENNVLEMCQLWV